MVGGTGGIGRATAVAFGEAGASVVVAGRRGEEGAETVGLVEKAGGQATFVRADVTSEDDIAALMDAAVDTYGGLDCAFNNAGLDLNVGVADATVEDFAAEVDTNTRGALLCLKHEIRVMREHGGGAIVTTARCRPCAPRPPRRSTD